MVHRVEEPRNESIRIRMNVREKQAFERQAKAEGLPLSVWIRTHLMELVQEKPAAKKPKRA